ncbi:MAG: response regulator transcription factor [Planctomycetota bacterium]
MPKTKVLIVEDYPPLADTLEYQLTKAGYEVFRSSDGHDALNQARLQLPDIVILDVDLPVLSGVEVCRQLRARSETAEMLIVMLSAMGEESDQVVGFAVGADDYIVKPLESYAVLLQKLKALLRRRQSVPENNESVSLHGVTVDRRRFDVRIADETLQVTKSEFRLLDTLIRQPGRAFDRSELVEAALGGDAMVLERTIDVHIRSLRKKMKTKYYLIETVRGVGYRYTESDNGPGEGSGDGEDSP